MIQTTESYFPKDLLFNDIGRDKLIEGVRKMSLAVKSTLGPRGNTVLIESPTLPGGITVTKDGVTVAKAVDLVDPVENLSVRMMKLAADKTAMVAGDGTTTAIVLTEAMVIGGSQLITSELNRTEVLRAMVDISDRAVDKLRKSGKNVTNSLVFDVATISANNDREIGRIIADAYKKVGRSGLVTVERSKTTSTYSQSTSGLKFDRGYLSPLFINDQKKDECLLEDVLILVSDVEISNVLQIESVLKFAVSENKKLLIISPCSVNFINTLAANVMKGVLKICAVAPPSFGYKQHELMQDIALSVGATYFSEKTGDDLSLIKPSDLGHAASVAVSKDKTIIIRSEVRAKQELIDERVKQLRESITDSVSENDKSFILERIASLTGGIGVIFVGGNTDIEQKELYDRVDDAVCAVRSALEEGVLPGAGKALYEINAHEIISSLNVKHVKEYQCAALIMDRAFKAPLQQILENAGLDDARYIDCPKGHGLNVKTEEFGDLFEMGVIDPVKVTRSALQNAVSVATTILSTNAIITMARA